MQPAYDGVHLILRHIPLSLREGWQIQHHTTLHHISNRLPSASPHLSVPLPRRVLDQHPAILLSLLCGQSHCSVVAQLRDDGLGSQGPDAHHATGGSSLRQVTEGLGGPGQPRTCVSISTINNIGILSERGLT